MRAFITPKNKAQFLPAFMFLRDPAAEFELIRRTFLYGCYPEMTCVEAARRGLLEVVQYKLEVENAHHASLVDILCMAINRGHLHIVKYLNAIGVDVRCGMTIAARGNHWLIVEYFISRGRGLYVWNAVLQKAAQYGNEHIVRLCLEEGEEVDIHAMDDFALRMSAERGYYKIARALLEHGANVHAGNEHALIYASRNGHGEVVKLLLDYGANARIYDYRALRYAAYEGHLSIVQVLVQYGSDVHALADDAFCKAVDYDHLDVVKYFVEECGVSPHVNHRYGVRWASIYKHRSIEAYLRGF